MLFSRLVAMLPRSLSGPMRPLSAAETIAKNATARSVQRIHVKAMASSSSESSDSELSSRPRLVYSIYDAPGHELEDHVERPARVQGIVRALTQAHFLGPEANPTLVSKIKQLTPSRLAAMNEIALVHTYGEDLKAKSAAATPQAPIAVADLGDPDGVTYVTPSSWENAITALGTSLQLVDEVITASKTPQTPTSHPDDPSGTPTGFGIVRPPGHHATTDTPLGYCLLNNIAVAARYAQQKYGLKKVFILDYDVHNGNGTCEAFWEDPDILVLDMHEENTVYPAPEFIPSGAEDIGAGPGEGMTINVPLPRYAGDEAMKAMMQEIVIPVVRRFNPDLILVSAGYDAHVTDPFQLLQMRSSTYYQVAKQLRELADELCGGRLLFLLEGGYDADALGESVVETWLALLGEESKEGKKKMDLPQPEPMEAVRALLQRLKQIHKIL